MTPENKMLNISMEYEEAMRCRQLAKIILREGFPKSAVSRFYYAVFHMVRALLLTIDEQPRSHHGALHLFSLHFVRKGTFPKKYSKLFADLQKHRELSDYDTAFILTDEDVRADFKNGETIIKAIEKYMVKEEYLHND